MDQYWTSWGRLDWVNTPPVPFKAQHFTHSQSPTLAIGNLRSYGDSCLLHNGTVFSMTDYDHFLAWDPKNGRIKVQSGALFDSILQHIVPQGWFLPVTPGTKYITVGGAIANDIHGKNHHIAGNFGHFVIQLELLRSNGERLLCSPSHNRDLFYATIGGLGLTGIILWAEIQLIPISSPMMNVEWIQFEGLSEYMEINKASASFPYTVAWLDCVSHSGGKASAKGVYIRGTHSTAPSTSTHPLKKKTVPIDFPTWALNPLSIKAFNTLYYHKQITSHKTFIQHYDPFFYPLDSILQWNRIYGKNGFYQYQCLIPLSCVGVLQTMLDCIAASGQASFLSVLKTFGDIPSLGLLSFPQEGLTLCLDFANKGQKTLQLFRRLDDMVMAAKGRRYPAKDATLSSHHFKEQYPQWKTFLTYKDPALVSEFWKRTGGKSS